METSTSDRLPPDANAQFAARARSISVGHAPRENRLLAALPPQDYARLLPDLEPVSLSQGWESTVPVTAKSISISSPPASSRGSISRNGASVEFAVTGNEGVIGVASFLGGESTTSQALVLSAGFGYRLRADRVRHEFEHGGPLSLLLLRYTQALIAQIGLDLGMQAVSFAGAATVPLDAVMSRPVATNELQLTQGLIAQMLGVRREGVTEAARAAAEGRVVHCGRGHIAVLDRPALRRRRASAMRSASASTTACSPTIGKAGPDRGAAPR